MKCIFGGYDIRFSPEHRPGAWMPRNDKEGFLVTATVALPLSVDPAIWPSPLARPTAQRPAAADTRCEPDTPLGLWSSPDRLRKCAVGELSIPHEIIAVFLLHREPMRLDGWLAAAFGTGALSDYEPRGDLIGLDIADQSLVSAISDCGYNPEEIISTRNKFVHLLNAHGLFQDVVPAFEFRATADQLCPEHSPFYVFALHRFGRNTRGETM